ncbi:MAG: CoA-binding protein [Dehalococcoidales bacterium]|nr:CoA-binding protein [Dehalococcoidales bacterium]
MSARSLSEILHPKSIAIVGASDNPKSQGYNFTRLLFDYGYRGRIYPVNPRLSEILGTRAYASLREIPDSIDYVICAIPAVRVLDVLQDCAQKGVKCVHLFTGRFSETGRQDATGLEQAILQQAQRAGIRLIGPNCLGLYYPGEGISFGYDFPKDSGTVGMASQSGGGATYLVQSAAPRGIRFSKVISYGNALDFNECDYLDYFAQDPETKVILIYLEGTKDGLRLFRSLRQAALSKPTIVLKGGRGAAGMRMANSHTAALVSSRKTWETMVNQAGAVAVRDFDEMIDMAVSFCFLPAIKNNRVGIVGVGGGPSVLAADQCEESGLNVMPLSPEFRNELKDRGIPIWDWINNPIDASILAEFTTNIQLLEMMAESKDFDLLMGIVNEDAPFSPDGMISLMRTDVEGYVDIKKRYRKPLLGVAGEKGASINNYDHWHWRMLSEAREKLLAANIPVFPTVERAARSTAKLIDYYKRRAASNNR